MNAEGKQPLDGSHWTTAKLSTLLKNPIYVKADSNVYDYYDRHRTEIVTDVSQFTGEFGASSMDTPNTRQATRIGRICGWCC